MSDQRIEGTASTCGCYRTVTRDEHGVIIDIDEGFCETHWRELWDRYTPRTMQYEHAGMDTEYADHTPDRYYDEED